MRLRRRGDVCGEEPPTVSERSSEAQSPQPTLLPDPTRQPTCPKTYPPRAGSSCRVHAAAAVREHAHGEHARQRRAAPSPRDLHIYQDKERPSHASHSSQSGSPPTHDKTAHTSFCAHKSRSHNHRTYLLSRLHVSSIASTLRHDYLPPLLELMRCGAA